MGEAGESIAQQGPAGCSMLPRVCQAKECPQHQGGAFPSLVLQGCDAVPSLGTVPTGAPRNVVVQAATATQLDVTWEPPPLESQNGDIQGYKVPPLSRDTGGCRDPAGCWVPLMSAGLP